MMKVILNLKINLKHLRGHQRKLLKREAMETQREKSLVSLTKSLTATLGHPKRTIKYLSVKETLMKILILSQKKKFHENQDLKNLLSLRVILQNDLKHLKGQQRKNTSVTVTLNLKKRHQESLSLRNLVIYRSTQKNRQ